MRKSLITIVAIIAMINLSFAQMARLQVIHNAADPAANTVDIYVNGGIFLDDFAFRTSTAFSDVPANTILNIAVAPASSSSVADAIATIPVGPLTMNETYVLIANGTVASGFDANPDGVNIGFNLFPYAPGQETGSNTNDVDLLVFHGSTDAPTVDVVASTQGGTPATLIDDIAYTDFQGYASVPPAEYLLEVKDASGTTTVASYVADISGLAGGAAVVYASGFLNAAQGPAFGLFVALPSGGMSMELPSPTSRLQVIHNAADPAASTVDVYVNDGLFIDDFDFRTSTAFTDVPANATLNVAVAPGNSSSVADAITTIPVGPLAWNETYVLIANGTVGSGFDANPDGVNIGFNLFPYAPGQETGSNTNDVDLLVFHGATDAPTVDVVASTQGGTPATLIDDIAYTDFQGYASVPPAEYLLEVKDASGTTTVASYVADISGLAGGAAVVYASGFLNAAQGPAFGLFIAMPSGGMSMELPSPTSRLQVIHNAADPAAASVDVYVNDGLFIDDFDFRTSTAFADVPANAVLNIAVAPASSSSVADAITTIPVGPLAWNETYVLIANGAIGSGFDANPDGVNIGFNLFPFAPAQESGSNSSDVDLLVFHGSTDAPTVDVVASAEGATPITLIDDITYTDFQGYATVPAAEYLLEIKDATGTTTVASFIADVSALGGGAAVVFASGFFNSGQGPAFGLYAALPSGGAALELPTPGNARLQVIHNAADMAASTVDIWVNGNLAVDDFEFRTATPFIDAPAGLTLYVGVAPANSSSSADAIATIPVGPLMDGETYIAIANGIVSSSGYNPSPAFGLDIFTGAREQAMNQGAAETDVLVYHGSTDAPTVDVEETGVGAGVIVDDISYGEFQGYLSLGTSDYTLGIVAGGETVVSYDSPLSTLGLQDAAITVLASGFLDPSQNSNGPAFGLYAALPAGGELVALPVATTTGIEERVALESIIIYPNPATEQVNVNFNLIETSMVDISIYNSEGKIVRQLDAGQLNAGTNQVQMDLTSLSQGYYLIGMQVEGEQTSYPIFVE